jgi:hypothetical protein
MRILIGFPASLEATFYDPVGIWSYVADDKYV